MGVYTGLPFIKKCQEENGEKSHICREDIYKNITDQERRPKKSSESVRNRQKSNRWPGKLHELKF